MSLLLPLLAVFFYYTSAIPLKETNKHPVVTANLEEKDKIIENTVLDIMSTWSSNNKTSNLIEATIDEVETLLARDPSLPRLTRGEILDLIENITKASLEKMQTLNRHRSQDQRAIMLVLPFSPKNNTGSNLQELYTRPPIIKIIEDQTDRPEMRPVRRRRPTLPPTPPPLDFTSTTSLPNEITFHTEKTTTVFPSTVEPITTTEIQLSPQKSSLYPIFEPNKTNKSVSLRKYPIKSVNKYTTEKSYFPEKISISSNEGLKIIPPPDLSRPYTVENKPSQSSEEILIAQESLPMKPSTVSSSNSIQIVDEFKSTNSANQRPFNIRPTYQVPDSVTATSPDISGVVDNLSPELKKLLMSFGLVPDQDEKHFDKTSEFDYKGPETPTFNPDSFVHFKPLPDDAPTKEEMNSFLARFGLDRHSRRSKQEKDAANSQKDSSTEIEMDILPEDMKEIVSDIGLTDRQGKKISLEGMEKSTGKLSKEDSYERELEELRKLKEILKVVKQIDEMNETQQKNNSNKVDLNYVKELLNSFGHNTFVPLDAQNGAPDPLNYNYYMQKITVKRQGNGAPVEDKDTTTPPSETETESPTPADATPSLKDLEDSFGGSSDITTTTTTTEPSTTARSGFYYLVDWNSFLEVDDERGRRVNIRFQPKVGDPKKFFAVTVP